MRKFLSVFALCSLLADASAQTNGIVAELRLLGTGTCSSDSGMLSMTYLVRNAILRIDLKGPYANGSIVYQPSSDKLWVLFHNEKIYYSMTKTAVDSFNARVAEISKELDEKYKNMNEKEKAEMDGHWKMGNPFRNEDYYYERVKKEDSLVSQLICDKYRAEAPGHMTRFAYLNNLKTTGIKDEELKILTEFAAFIGTGMNSMTGNMDMTVFRKWNEGGYPVFIKTVSGNLVCHEIWTQFVYRSHIRDEDFQIPFDYRREQNPLGY